MGQSWITTILRALAGRPLQPHHGAAKLPDHRGRPYSQSMRLAGQSSTGRDRLIRTEIALPALIFLIAVACALFWVGWSVVADTTALTIFETSPETALIFTKNNPAVLDKLAINTLTKPDGDLNAATEWARRALRANPLDDEALLVLGLVAEKNGDNRRAATLIGLAGQRTRRNFGTEVWQFKRDVVRGAFFQALQHADAIFRADNAESKYRELIFPTVAAFTSVPPASRALANYLSSAPSWRSWFLTKLVSQAASGAGLDFIYSQLGASPRPPSGEEFQPYVSRLIRDKRYEKAFEVWQSTLSDVQRAHDEHPFNGDFKFQPNGEPFDWVLRSVPGADVKIVSSDAGKFNALRVRFSGARVAFANVQQLMLLPPGKYRFTGSVRANDLVTSRGLWWHIFCEDQEKSLGQSELVSGTHPWTDFAVEFEISPGCAVQWIRLELPARIESEKRIEGEVWYRKLRIVRVPAAAG